MTPKSEQLPPWRPLLKAASHREGRSPMGRWLQLATIAADGSPRVRTLVFRGWRDGQTLELFTDSRSAKAQELVHDHRLEVCWLLPKARCQFRLRGHALQMEAHDQDHREDTHWQQLRPEARALWGWPEPGALKEPNANVPSAIPDGTPTPENFLLLSLEITQVELLELTKSPHRRRRWLAEDGWIERDLNP